MTAQLAEEEQVAYRRILNELNAYMERHYADEYSFIMGATFGGNLLYTDPALNITKEVVAGLNEEYKKGSSK